MERIEKQFLRYVGQTSPAPMSLTISRAEGIYMYTPEGKRYVDLISGVSVSNVGHSNAAVVDAVVAQARDYMHLMVYGEYIQSPQVEFAMLLGKYLPEGVDSIYFVNSGSEAIEGATKLAKRYTGRTELVSFRNAYHGSTHGALSLMGSEYYKSAFRPLLPGIRQIGFNNIDDLKEITTNTAAVVIEPIQGEGGFRIPDKGYMLALRKRCTETGALLIFDEIQSGFGRTGKMFAWEYLDVKPDIVCMAKAMGGGMPLGGFAANKNVMDSLTFNPVLGHITTFGGHPVCCAAGMAAMKYLIDNKVLEEVESKSELFEELLSGNNVEIRRAGLMIAIDFRDNKLRDRVVSGMIDNGVMTEGFLFCDTALRIAPPLVISCDQIREVCDIFNKVISAEISALG